MSDLVHLIITHPVGDYERGALVTEPSEVEALLRDHGSKVVTIIPQDNGE